MCSTKLSGKSIGKKRSMRLLAVLLVAVFALILGAAAPEAGAGGSQFGVTEFKIEFNSSDQDLGVQAFIDGEPWKKVIIVDPKGRTILAIGAFKSMRKQGLTELFFESGEPPLDEVSIQEFLARFPRGKYRFYGLDVDGKFVRGKADFTWVIPCGLEDGVLKATGDNAAANPIVLSWKKVEQVVDLDKSTFNNVTCEDSDDLEIVAYRVEAEWEDEDEVVHRFGIDLNADQTEVTLPPEFIPEGQEYKFEVLAIEISGNQTLTESGELTTPE